MPIVNKAGKAIGVTQVLNKRGGPFTAEDESRLRAFTAQIASGLENAKLFADVQAMRNYNEAMLQSMSNGVITFDERGPRADVQRRGRAHPAARGGGPGRPPSAEVFGDENVWLRERMQRVGEELRLELVMDAELIVGDETASVNVTVLPLLGEEGEHLGTLVMIEDISNEKRVRSTMSRYMDPDLADRLLARGRRSSSAARSRSRPSSSPTSAASPRSPSSSARTAPSPCSTSTSS